MRRSGTNRRFVTVHPGAVKARIPFNPQSEGCPSVFYQQRNQPTCLWVSVASALHHLGLCNEAAAFYAHARMLLLFQDKANGESNSQLSWKSFQAVANKVLPHLCRTLHCDLGVTDFIQLCASNLLVVAHLEDTHGSLNHAVSVVDGFIFDGKEQWAYHLSNQALDKCVSTNKIACTVKQIYRCVAFDCFDYSGTVQRYVFT